jgi:c-di-AMP phosphodiesterase-like protein
MNPVDFKSKASAIADAEFTEYGAAYATTVGQTGNTQIINAQVADELMMVRGMKATFVLGTNEKGQTIISARSIGDVNVQAIMEKFGGGGHFTSAAAQVDDTMENVKTQLMKIVRDCMEKDNPDND